MLSVLKANLFYFESEFHPNHQVLLRAKGKRLPCPKQFFCCSLHVLSSTKSFPEELCVERILTIGTFNMCLWLLAENLAGQIFWCIPDACPNCPEKMAVTWNISSCWSLTNLGDGHTAVLFNASCFPEALFLRMQRPLPIPLADFHFFVLNC